MFRKLFLYFIPKEYLADEEKARKSKISIGAYLIVAYFNTQYVIISYLLDYDGGLYSQVPLFFVSVFSAFLFKWKVHPHVVNHFFFISCVLSIATTIYFTNGYESFILPWIASTPIVALLVSSKRGGFVTLIGCICSLSIFYYLHLQGYDFPEDYNLAYKNIFSYTTHLGLILILYGVALVFENAKNTALKNLDTKNRLLDIEKKRSDDLLANILPEEVIIELKEKGHSKARSFGSVTVLFTDFVNFTQISESMTPEELVNEIDLCFTGFDEIIVRNGLEKIKTIGDAYLAVCGLPNPDPDHARKVMLSALDILEFMKERKKAGGRITDIRIGIHSGPVVAGIVGEKKYAYDIWGDTVNTAARMENNSTIGKINVSGSTFSLIKDTFACAHRGKIDVKGKGQIDMYFVENKIIHS